MTNTAKQYGFHAIEAVVILAVVGLVGVAGYKVMHHNKPSDTANTAVTEPAAPQITSTKDLDTASSTVDQLDTSGSDLSDMTSLEQELNSL
ncbi:MAG TPA: hypothetical protein VLH86_04055 [Patescibacteria group bacterium]|nr:hypothetical protein [Patescibacteria group bacterium]